MKFTTIAAIAAASLTACAANAATFSVSAFDNSSSGTGVGLASVSLTAGEAFQVSVDPSDLWSAGALPRWSNADGLTGNRFATGTDESGEPAGTLIGQDFGLWTEDGLSAPFGTLVGELGGVFKVLGTNFNGTAWNTGTLNLFYWDSNNVDNTGSVLASVIVTNVPEPVTWSLMILGFGMAGSMLRRRRAVASDA
ncbi:MAG TPA: PEPxxWA-CTERM sorting domain-containing protein [Phenylobacterium sp.]|nr:PEPxxWA-CTERM sorting domain-containing protein [Phenylobacterium sp.]